MKFQKILEILKQTLKKDERLERLVINDNLFQNTIIELSLKYDLNLLRLLNSSPELKKHFFMELGEMLVFNQIKFQNFISNKNFLSDNFTRYKNKIGLASDRWYLANSEEIALAWPYKDCILEGGQDQEDAKRDEVFWNEILASDEVDRLLEPKVLTNFKKYDRGEEISLSLWQSSHQR